MDGQIRPRLATSSIVASFPTIRKQLSRPLRRLTPRSRAESAGRLYSTCAMRMGVGGEAGSRKGQIRPGRPFLACQTTIAALPASCRGRRRRGKRAEQGKSPRQHLELTAKFAGGRAGAREEDVGEERKVGTAPGTLGSSAGALTVLAVAELLHGGELLGLAREGVDGQRRGAPGTGTGRRSSAAALLCSGEIEGERGWEERRAGPTCNSQSRAITGVAC
uniref:Uncharacterized protein n=1 Tax=Setaria italica TaxID=4555 RepID=K3YNR6_SETIT